MFLVPHGGAGGGAGAGHDGRAAGCWLAKPYTRVRGDVSESVNVIRTREGESPLDPNTLCAVVISLHVALPLRPETHVRMLYISTRYTRIL